MRKQKGNVAFDLRIYCQNQDNSYMFQYSEKINGHRVLYSLGGSEIVLRISALAKKVEPLLWFFFFLFLLFFAFFLSFPFLFFPSLPCPVLSCPVKAMKFCHESFP